MRLPDPLMPLHTQPPAILLAMVLFGEARNQGREGMAGVANTINNRRGAPRNSNGRRFGAGWRGVILRPGSFDCLRESDPNFPKLLRPCQYEPGAWVECLDVAEAMMRREIPDNTDGATHYHDASVRPWWASPEVIAAGRMVPTVQIGKLFFYREP